MLVASLDIRSLLNPLKNTAISDLTDTRNIDVFALTETWITPSAIPSQLRNATPSGFFLVSHLRIAPANHSNVVGGGTAFLLRDSVVIVKSPPCPTFKTCELSVVTLKLLHSKLTIFNAYRPPPATTKTRKSMPFSLFLRELNTFIFCGQHSS